MLRKSSNELFGQPNTCRYICVNFYGSFMWPNNEGPHMTFLRTDCLCPFLCRTLIRSEHSTLYQSTKLFFTQRIMLPRVPILRYKAGMAGKTRTSGHSRHVFSEDCAICGFSVARAEAVLSAIEMDHELNGSMTGSI